MKNKIMINAVIILIIMAICGFGIYGCGDSRASEIEKLIPITSEKIEACNQYLKDGYKMEKEKDGYIYVTNIDVGLESCGQAEEYCKKLDKKIIEFSKLPISEFMDFLSSEHGKKAEDIHTQRFALSMDIPLFYRVISNSIDEEYLRKAYLEPIDQDKKDYLDKVMRLREIGLEMGRNMATHSDAMLNIFKEKK